MLDKLKEQVVKELRHKKIKLWLPPYYFIEDDIFNENALAKMADTLSVGKKLAASEKGDIMAVVKSLQIHAVDKLNYIPLLEIKVLGLSSEAQISGKSDSTLSCAKQMETLQTPQQQHNYSNACKKSLTLRLHKISKKLMISRLIQDIKEYFNVSHVRLVYKGKNLYLKHKLEDSLLRTKSERSTMNNRASDNNDLPSILCMVSNIDTETSSCNSSEQNMIASIRQAAKKIQNVRFDITDQYGRHVAISPNDRLAFFSALGLHSLGRKHIDDNPHSALIFLLEADAEWDRVSNRDEWTSKVDNYGLLQLDISWVYLQLQSLPNLPNVLRRLEVAETCLQRQVNKNFITLALVQADLGNVNAIPPLAVIFTRLFLLQGVAYSHTSNNDNACCNRKKSEQRLSWAYSLCQGLRHVAPEKTVLTICSASGASKSRVRSALRRVNGDTNTAFTVLEEDKNKKIRENKRRDIQRQIGYCDNGIDYVKLELVSQLQIALDLDLTLLMDEEIFTSNESDSYSLVAAGLLRLANNDIERAIDLYQKTERSSDAVLDRVDEMNIRLKKLGLWLSPPKRVKYAGQKMNNDVDDIALTTLVSMGVEESLSMKALKSSNNNVELALLWLSSSERSSNIQDNESKISSILQTDEMSNEDEVMRVNDNGERNTKKEMSQKQLKSELKNKLSNEQEVSESRSSSIIQTDKTSNQTEGMKVDDNSERDAKEEAAQMLLQSELMKIFAKGQEDDREYLGSSLDNEWRYLQIYHKTLNH